MIAKEKVENDVFKITCYFITSFSYLQRKLVMLHFSMSVSNHKYLQDNFFLIFPRMQTILKFSILM